MSAPRARPWSTPSLDDELVGAVALADIVRKESRDAVAKLREMGIECMMLTGDARAVAKSVAAELGLDDYFAEVLPDQKADKVREVQGRGLPSPWSATASTTPRRWCRPIAASPSAPEPTSRCSRPISCWCATTRATSPRSSALSRATYRKMIENFVLGAGYNVVAIPLAAGVAYAWGMVLTPAGGAALMSASTVVVAINAKLLERRRKDIAALGLADS